VSAFDLRTWHVSYVRLYRVRPGCVALRLFLPIADLVRFVESRQVSPRLVVSLAVLSACSGRRSSDGQPRIEYEAIAVRSSQPAACRRRLRR
jgi:hypothetical protein